jgi:hypothetical protein
MDKIYSIEEMNRLVVVKFTETLSDFLISTESGERKVSPGSDIVMVESENL